MNQKNQDSGLSISRSNKTALLFGSTGLIGGYCKDFLLGHPAYRKLRCFQRTKEHSSREDLEIHSIDFDRMEEYAHLIKGHDLFLCLGTTIRKAGNKEQFFKVDHDFTLKAARIALENGASQVMLVSAVGADRNSWFFYSRVKGAVEDDLRALPYWSIHIFRPSVLLGERSDSRFGEEIAGTIGQGLDWITGGLLTKYKPVEAEVVARAMVKAAQKLESGIHIYPSHELQELSEKHYYPSNKKT